MKKLFTLVFTIFFTISLAAQVTIAPNIISFESTGDNIALKIDVTNNTAEYVDIYWIFEKGENYPEEWGTTICDDEICYLMDILKSSPGLPNDMDQGYSFKFKFTISTNGVPGTSFGILHLYSDSKFENEVAVSSLPITSVYNELEKDITIYPNPSSDYFQIKNDEDVSSMEILGITGKMYMNESHVENKIHSITHLPNGMFFVVLRDENGEKLKTLRLIK